MDLTQELTPIFWLASIGLLGWGFWRARKRGKAAQLLWLQGSMLFVPWLVFLGLMAFGIYLNIASFILMLLVFTVVYIGLGQRVRAIIAQMPLEEQRKTRPVPASSEQEGSLDPMGATEIPRMAPEDMEGIRGIFGIDTFFATEAIPYGEGAIFKGNLRGDPEEVLQQLTPKLQALTGDRYQLYLVEDTRQKPAMVVLPTEAVNQKATTGTKILAVLLLATSLVSSMEVGANLLGFRLLENGGAWPLTLPFAAGLLAILLLHEVGHRWMAGRYGVRLSPAFVIPSFGIGTLGSLNRIESPVPNRQALFDISFAGPAVGGVVSLVLLIVGLLGSGGASDLFVPAELFRSSILVGMLTRLVLGSELQTGVVGVSPLVAIGWIGLGITALSLLPAGQLDGGRMVQAVYGRQTSGRATFVSLIVLGIAALSNVLALYWALIILFIAREPERPPLNELTETDGLRDTLALLALFLMALVLLPITPALASVLHFPG